MQYRKRDCQISRNLIQRTPDGKLKDDIWSICRKCWIIVLGKEYLEHALTQERLRMEWREEQPRTEYSWREEQLRTERWGKLSTWECLKKTFGGGKAELHGDAFGTGRAAFDARDFEGFDSDEVSSRCVGL